MNNPKRFNYRIGDELIHWSTGAQVRGTIIEITDNWLTTQHKPQRWGDAIFKHTYIAIDDTGKGTPRIIKRL